jgi:hypothetical protein
MYGFLVNMFEMAMDMLGSLAVGNILHTDTVFEFVVAGTMTTDADTGVNNKAPKWGRFVIRMSYWRLI